MVTVNDGSNDDDDDDNNDNNDDGDEAISESLDSDAERKQEVKNARGGDDEEIDDTDEDQVNLCIALVYVPRGVL